MAEQNYMDIKGMQERIDEKNRQQKEQFYTRLNAMAEHKKKEQGEMQELFAKVILSEREEKEKKRQVEIEREKAKAIADIEAKYESQGVKSEATKRKNAALKSMLQNMRGSNKRL